MAHQHEHGEHGRGSHSHAGAGFGRAFAVGVGLNALLVAGQVGVGWWAHSTALLADAVHNLGDTLGLLLAWLAAAMARRGPTVRRTYGWGRGSILAALLNASVLLVGTGAIAVAALQRLAHPAAVAGGPVMAMAAAAIVINAGVAWMFMADDGGGAHDLNRRAAFLHMAGDAGVSAGVLAAAGLILLTGAAWLDPLASLGISAVILVTSWGILREAVALAMDMVPRGIDPEAVRSRLLALPGVSEVHDLHIWALSTTHTAATAHLVAGEGGVALVPAACSLLHDEFGIHHCTFQVETAAIADGCAQRSPDLV